LPYKVKVILLYNILETCKINNINDNMLYLYVVDYKKYWYKKYEGYKLYFIKKTNVIMLKYTIN